VRKVAGRDKGARFTALLHHVDIDRLRKAYRAIPEQGRWLASVVRGHRAYYAVPGNRAAVATFRAKVTRLWHETLERRSQRTRINWMRSRRNRGSGAVHPCYMVGWAALIKRSTTRLVHPLVQQPRNRRSDARFCTVIQGA
jgi:hypothetical protein